MPFSQVGAIEHVAKPEPHLLQHAQREPAVLAGPQPDGIHALEPVAVPAAHPRPGRPHHIGELVGARQALQDAHLHPGMAVLRQPGPPRRQGRKGGYRPGLIIGIAARQGQGGPPRVAHQIGVATMGEQGRRGGLPVSPGTVESIRGDADGDPTGSPDVEQPVTLDIGGRGVHDDEVRTRGQAVDRCSVGRVTVVERQPALALIEIEVKRRLRASSAG